MLTIIGPFLNKRNLVEDFSAIMNFPWFTEFTITKKMGLLDFLYAGSLGPA